VTAPSYNPSPNQHSEEVEAAAYRLRVKTFASNRTAGDAITSRELEGGATLTNILNTAGELSAYAEQSLAAINQRYRPRLDCKKGCSYCCRKPGVLVSIPELIRILEHVRLTFSHLETAELTERARKYEAQMEGKNCDDLVDVSVPCPLLVENKCSIYEIRPLVCRGFNSTNVDACRAAHDNANVLVPIFALLKDVTDGLNVGATQRLKLKGLNDAMVDLGRALNIALASGPGFEQDIMNGSRALSPAENRSCIAELWNEVRRTATQLGIPI
jgi:Fe-S-cluster containining protein